MSNNSSPDNQGNQQSPQGTPVVSFNIDAGRTSGIPSDLSDQDFTVDPNSPEDLTGNDLADKLNNTGNDQDPPVDPNDAEGKDTKAQDKKTDDSADVDDTDKKDKEPEPGDDDFEGYTTSAKFAVALKESGLPLYEEIKKDLDAKTFVNDIQGFIDNNADQAVQERLEQIGPLANYVMFMYRGGNIDDINPAIQAQRYADVNLDDPNITEEAMESLAREMYVKKGISLEKANEYIELAKTKDRLKDEALESKEFHSELVKQMTANAQRAYEYEQQQLQAKRQQEAKEFAGVLESGDILGIKITRDQAGELYDYMWNRDQPVTTKDANGNPKREFVTKYEIAMHNAINDPSKLAFLSYLAYNDFSLESIMKLAQTKVSTDIFKAIDNPDRGIDPPQGGQGSKNKGGIESKKITSFNI